MTKVIFKIGEDTPHGVQLTKSTISVRPMRKRLNGEIVVTRAAQTYTLNQQAAAIELEPTGVGHAWIVSIVPTNGDVIVGYYKVPFTDEVAFSKLVEVDPETMESNAEPEPEWWAMAKSTVSTGKVVNGDLILESFDGETVNAGRVQGERGEQGKQGERGREGARGVQGEQGEQGEKGDPGIDGEPASIGGMLVKFYRDTELYPEFWLTTIVGGARGECKVEKLMPHVSANPGSKTMLEFHEKSGATALFNGSGFWSDGTMYGATIYHGEVLKGWDTGESDLGKEAVVFMRDGSVKHYDNTTEPEQIVSDGGWNSFSWGAAYFVNGEMTDFQNIWRYSLTSGMITARQMLITTKNGDLHFMTFKGVTNTSGATAQQVLAALNALNLDLDIVYNLDCGGSTQTLVSGVNVVRSSDPTPRAIGDAIAVYAENTTRNGIPLVWRKMTLTANYSHHDDYPVEYAWDNGVLRFRGAFKMKDGSNIPTGTHAVTAPILQLSGIDPVESSSITYGNNGGGFHHAWIQASVIQVAATTATNSYMRLSPLSGIVSRFNGVG